ncbi:cell division initiation protein [Sulfobacillus thermosulfidooxidans DSM 9293]|uniref:Cell division initiation protein n=2 Tax=Sulfobacillus thermosulfidooxidans TaxID=28034 RepID=A0A1W1WPJ3_SULTA|nr:DivIVA domain-containing protein [Sulfobacillus thermosulfidooxidans]PSR29998.1 MAG: DivIVA domain-containing protein [Sulfobacillus thermosulfidooxidans]SMC07643.1 cell division initiation protein [Sulfobacillus thermosulfidooxidans DSM 9293]
MPLTPLDIVNKEFKHGFRGYNEDDVNEFLDEIVRDYEALIRENDELKENTSGMTERLEQYRKLEATLQNTLVIAQQTAEEVKAAARKEAELIVREAEAKAEEIIRNAEARVREAENQLSQLRYETEKFRAQIKSLLEAQLRLVTEGPLLQAAVES